MITRTAIAAAAAAAATLAAPQARAELQVAATVPTLAALAAEVGGSRVVVRTLSLPTQDPHFVDPKPSLVLELNRADVLIAVGLELEIGWLPTLQTGARNRKIQRGAAGYIECASYVPILDIPTQKVDRSMGDVHPGGNPHYLYDPRGALGCAYGIAARLAVIDPAGAAEYRRNLAAFKQRLAGKMAGWQRALAPYRGAPVVTHHRSWIYLLDWSGLREVATLEPKPGISPSPRHVAAVIQRGRQAKVRSVLIESFYPVRTAKLVAGKMGAQLAVVPSGPDVAQGQSYFDYMDAVVSTLVKSLGAP
jgi:zinc/manganese transport system substrate-binding protein